LSKSLKPGPSGQVRGNEVEELSVYFFFGTYTGTVHTLSYVNLACVQFQLHQFQMQDGVTMVFRMAILKMLFP